MKQTTTSKRLEILKNSLVKKETSFDAKLQNHFDTVKQGNGQPMNDKRNGQATLNKWDKQNNSLRTLNQSIEITKSAIEEEQSKILYTEKIKETLPAEFLELIENNEITQWRKYPNMFFVTGVDKARIIWDAKANTVAHKYTSTITDKEQWKLFAKTYNLLYNSLKNK